MRACPICKAGSVEIEPGFFDGISLRCPNHGDFGISDTALTTRVNASQEQWAAAFKAASDRAVPNSRPKILDSDF